VAVVKFREPFDRCLHRYLILMSQAMRAVCWVAGLLPARLTGVLVQFGLPGHGQLRDLVQRNEASIRLGAFTKNSTRLSTTHHTHTHTQTIRVAPWAQ